MTNKLPAFQFYPADWRKDPGVQALSYEERGIWFEILCLMHESEDRGRLLLAGRPMPDEALARTLGLDKQILTNALTKFLDYGVASRDENDALINRRMVRDENLRKIRSNCGKLGGNPSLLNQNPTSPPSKTQPKAKQQSKQIPTPSSSSSSSSSDKNSATRAGTVSQDEFIAKLTINPAYRDIDIDREFAKAEAWCEVNGRRNTQRFFVNWLNRIEPTVNGNGRRHNAWADVGRPATPEMQEAIDLVAPPPRKPKRPPADSPPEHRALWTAFLDHVKAKVNTDVYQTWFADALIFDGLNDERNAFRVRAGQVTRDWIQLYYAELVYETFTAIGCAEFTIGWEIDEDEYEEVATA